MRSVGGALLVALLVLGTTHRAQADGRTCGAAAEDGQRARARGQLRQAHRQFLACSLEECPALVRRDCTEWASSVAEMLPTIVVDARDSGGRDVGDVTVSIDDVIVARSLDGTAIPVDPGPHTLLFERVGSLPVTEKVIIKEGARRRTFVVKFAGIGAGPAAPDVQSARGHTVLPWVLVGVGGAALITGVVVAVTAPAFPAGCDSDTDTCTKAPNEADDVFAKRQKIAGDADTKALAGLVIGGAGIAIVTAGLLWHFLERTGPAKSTPSARVVPWTTADGGGMAAIGTF